MQRHTLGTVDFRLNTNPGQLKPHLQTLRLIVVWTSPVGENSTLAFGFVTTTTGVPTEDAT
jgi:hypothetical protein